MIQFISFAFIFGCLTFIWTFVFLNRSHDKKNQSFLYFLTAIIIWMVLSVSNTYEDFTLFGIIVKTVYWYSMLTMSLFFLRFVYRLINRKPDVLFYIFVAVNLLTILARYLYPMDYSDPTFWRLSDPIVAPLMSLIFSTPAIFALYLVLKDFRSTKDRRKKAQFKNIFIGTGLALLISVISEYMLPTLFHINLQLSLMYYAYFVFVLFLFISIMKHRLLYIQADYIYKKLYLNSNEGIIIVGKNSKIININNKAKQILKDGDLSVGEVLTDYIKGYSFDLDYMQQEMVIGTDGQEQYLAITQYAIDTELKGSAKLVIITDISAAKLHQQREKDMLLEKTNIDQLTDVFNKQYFVEKYCSEAAAADVRMALLFIDVDNFKLINDQYGHLFGDKVLADLAACFKRTVRKGTEIIRFGGDEFLILLAGADISQACTVAERVRNAVNDACFYTGENAIRITVSIGAIEGTAPVNDLLMKADMAMYRSKGKGKNTITVFTEDDDATKKKMNSMTSAIQLQI